MSRADASRTHVCPRVSTVLVARQIVFCPDVKIIFKTPEQDAWWCHGRARVVEVEDEEEEGEGEYQHQRD